MFYSFRCNTLLSKFRGLLHQPSQVICCDNVKFAHKSFMELKQIRSWLSIIMVKKRGRPFGSSKQNIDRVNCLGSKFFIANGKAFATRRKLLFEAIAICIALIGGLVWVPLASADWPMYRSDPAHSGTGIGNPVLTPNLLWAENVSNIAFCTSPAICEGVVYVCETSYVKGYHDQLLLGNGSLLAFNASSGERIWSYPENDVVFNSPAVSSGIVIDLFYKEIIALNATDGVSIWNYSAPVGVSSPAIINGVVYVGNFEVLALNLINGHKIWNFTTGGGKGSSPAIVNGVVYIGLDNLVYALSASDGALLWVYPTRYDIRGSPAIWDGAVYIGSGDGHLYALNASDGKKLWNYTLTSILGTAFTPAVFNGNVYVGDQNGAFYALGARDGVQLWNFTIGGYNSNDPVVVDGVVYVNSDSGTLYALDASNGEMLWSYPIAGAMAYANGVLYIGSQTGVTALGIPIIPSISPSPVPSPSIPEFAPYAIPTVLIITTSTVILIARRKRPK